MIRSRPLALLAALLLLPGEAARAGAWCGVAGGAVTTHHANRAAQPAEAGADAPMPASHAAHHAMMTHDGGAMMTEGAVATAAAEPRATAATEAGAIAPTDAPTPPQSPTDCPLMAACASAAVSITVRLSDIATRDVAERANADEPDALATRSIAPEPPPPR